MKTLLFILTLFSPTHAAELTGSAFFNQYCVKRKQVKSLSELITVKVLPAPKGLPLDEAERILKKRRAAARTLVKMIYRSQRSCFEHDCSDKIRKAANSGQHNYYPDLFEGLEFYAGAKLTKLSSEELPSLAVIKELKKSYAFRIPFEEQEKLFGFEPQGFFMDGKPQCGNDERSGDFIGLNDECKFRASTSILHTAYGFDSMTSRFNRVTESTDDPNSIKFKIDLDLSILCAYGILKSELLSK